MIRSLRGEPPFEEISALLRASATGDPALPGQVAAIIDRVVRQGDRGLLDCVREFDGEEAESVKALRIPEEALARPPGT